MSGGSFNHAYLAADDRTELFKHIGDFEGIATALDGMKHKEAAEHIRTYLAFVDAYMREIERMGKDLRGVMRAVEWERSGDCGMEHVDKAVAELLERKADE